MSRVDIGRRHPIYQKMVSYWQFWKDSYLGGMYYKKPMGQVNCYSGEGSYLFKYEGESAQKFADRHLRSYYENYCRLPVNTFTKYLFSDKQPIVRLADRPEYQKTYEPYLQNMDLKGNSVQAFMTRVTASMLVYGVAYILVDKPPLSASIQSINDQRRSGIFRSYANCISPLQVLDWAIDPYTKEYHWVLIQSEYYDDASPFASRASKSQYYLWTRSHVYRLDEQGEPLPGYPIQNRIGRVPMIPCIYSDVDQDGIPESMLSDIAPLNREIYNTASLYQEELYKLAFARLMMEQDEGDWNLQAPSTQDSVTVHSPESILMYPPKSNHPPSYLRFPVDALQEKRAYSDTLSLRILQLANLQKQEGTASQNYASGLSLAFSYNDTYYSVAQLAQKVELYERMLWDIIRMYDQTSSTANSLLVGTMKPFYPRDFDIFTRQQKLDGFKTIKQLVPNSPSLQIKTDQAIARLYMDLSSDEEVLIQNELEQGYLNSPSSPISTGA